MKLMMRRPTFCARAMQPSFFAMQQPVKPFSEFFRELDKQSRLDMGNEFQTSKEYVRMQNLWKMPLLKKQAKKEQREARAQELKASINRD